MLFHKDRETLVTILREKKPADAAEIIAHIAPCAGLGPGGEGRSRVGGDPLAPTGFEWPRSQTVIPQGYFARLFGGRRPPPHPDGRALGFVIQVDIAALSAPLREHLNLPAAGLLSLFVDRDDWGNGREWLRFYVFEGDCEPTPPPEDLPAKRRLPETLLTVTPGWMTPDDPPLSEAGLELFEDLIEDQDLMQKFSPPEIIVGGWPMAVQSAVRQQVEVEQLGNPTALSAAESLRLERASQRFRQIIEMRPAVQSLNWMEDGVIYLLIDQADLAARRFDDAWPTMQFY